MGSRPPASAPDYGSSMAGAEEALDELKHFFVALGTADKLTFLGSLMTVLLGVLPWKETVLEGEVLGVLGLGLPVMVASAVAMAALAVRARRKASPVEPLVPMFLQLGAAGFALLWCLVFIRVSWDSRLAHSPVGNFQMPVSRPAFGVYLALLTTAVALGGTLLAFREKPD